MNRILGITLKILRSGQLSALVAMAGLGLLFSVLNPGVLLPGCPSSDRLVVGYFPATSGSRFM